MTFLIETTKAGKSTILFNNYKYREHYKLKTSDEISWRCLGRNCGASIRTNVQKTMIISKNEKHSGPHPITMRSHMSPRLNQSATSPAPDSEKLLSEINKLPEQNSSESSDSCFPSTFQPSTPLGYQTSKNSTVDSLLLENLKLKEQVAEMRDQLKCLLDHSVENDSRLLQYTNEIFAVTTPSQSKLKDPIIKTDSGIQCALPSFRVGTSRETQTETLCQLSVATQTESDNFLANTNKSVVQIASQAQDMARCNCSKSGDVCDNVLQDFFNFISKDTKYQNISFIPPSLIQWLKFVPDKTQALDQFVDVCDSKISHIVMAVNNSMAHDSTGSHWSLLVYCKSSNKYFHLDSIGGLNAVHAQRTAKLFHNSLGFQKGFTFDEVPCSLQKNGIDCGLYVIHNSSLVSEVISKGLEIENNVVFQQGFSVSSIRDRWVCPSSIIRQTPIESRSAERLKEFQTIKTKSTTRKANYYVRTTSEPKYLNKTNLSFKSFKSGTLPVALSNRFEPLQSLIEEENPGNQQTNSKEKLYKNLQKSVTILSDSHGRDLDKLLQDRCGDRVGVDGIIKPGAGIKSILREAANITRSELKHIILIAGANDVYNNQMQSLFEDLQLAVNTLSPCKVMVAGIPFRWDLDLGHRINENIMRVNLFIHDMAQVCNNVSFLDLTGFPRHCFDSSGVHFNHMGKHLISSKILQKIFPQLFKSFKRPFPVVSSEPGRTSLYEASTEKHSSKPKNKPEDRMENSTSPIKVLEADMKDIINEFQHEVSTAFAHCVSEDFGMNAGVATVFRKCFGRPKPADCLNEHLAVQGSEKGAFIYSLITKPKYSSKPTKINYNNAFQQLIKDFKNKNLKQLFCSPLGCTRDLISVDHFIKNLTHFQKCTNACVCIVVHDEGSKGKLREGVSYRDFVNKLKQNLHNSHYAKLSPFQDEPKSDYRKRTEKSLAEKLHQPSLHPHEGTSRFLNLPRSGGEVSQFQLKEGTTSSDLRLASSTPQLTSSKVVPGELSYAGIVYNQAVSESDISENQSVNESEVVSCRQFSVHGGSEENQSAGSISFLHPVTPLPPPPLEP